MIGFEQFGPRSGPTKLWACSRSRLFDTLIVFLKEFFEKSDLKNQQTTKKHEKLPSRQRVKLTFTTAADDHILNVYFLCP